MIDADWIEMRNRVADRARLHREIRQALAIVVPSLIGIWLLYWWSA